MGKQREPELSTRKTPEPLPVDPEERWDWDFDLGERPPPRRKWTVLAHLRYKKSEPLPLPDPDEE
jgi:hypothetical protein